ncbi:FtsB family cell division protein [Aerococcus urinaeequi]|uniref:Septum formation initiator n=1 Tax=Aerococcus urinaeequi TaxID=51665 RepID=A0A0U4VZ08_9LACT|nr:MULTISPECIES: septum formation initiator family protein [Lactobacillales]ALZ88459.1 septum formation initiator [Aerococcus urinaeequi]AMB97762.1 septum formation initiator [Aerococcus urinaeequi]KAF3302922.1 septum formation initiator family protein [Carnobacterium sp. PL26RED25]KAF3306273.1 septum formation initiator family protein [Carnobacterium sp. PL24RED07]MBA5746261.1 septum formation initiator family protein [Aerococcus urinaeequi]
MRPEDRPDRESKKVTSLAEHRKAKTKKWSRKPRTTADWITRLIVGIFAVVTLGCVSTAYAAHKDQQGVEEQIALTEDEIAGEQKAIDTLSQQASLLKDDEYVAKLARSRYYLSKDGEVIFSVPEDNASKQAEILNKAYLQNQENNDE